MSDVDEIAVGTERVVRIFARFLSVAWSLIWIVFGFISGIGEGLHSSGIASHTILPGVIFLLTSLLAWKKEGLGGIMIILEGLAITVYFLAQINRISTVGAFFVVVYATIPASFIGLLFIYGWRRSRIAHSASALTAEQGSASMA